MISDQGLAFLVSLFLLPFSDSFRINIYKGENCPISEDTAMMDDKDKRKLADDELEMVSGGISKAQLCYKNPNGPLFGHKWVQLEEICKCKYCEVDRTFVIYNKMTPLPKNLMDRYLDINGCN